MVNEQNVFPNRAVHPKYGSNTQQHFSSFIFLFILFRWNIVELWDATLKVELILSGSQIQTAERTRHHKLWNIEELSTSHAARETGHESVGDLNPQWKYLGRGVNVNPIAFRARRDEPKNGRGPSLARENPSLSASRGKNEKTTNTGGTGGAAPKRPITVIRNWKLKLIYSFSFPRLRRGYGKAL